MGFISEIVLFIKKNLPKKLVLSLVVIFCLIAPAVLRGQTDNQESNAKSSLDSSQLPSPSISDSLEKIKYMDRLFQQIVMSFSGSFGINGAIQNVANETVKAAIQYMPPDTLIQSDFRLYPFQYFSSISTNPNENFLLLKGPLIDYSQTHTLLPNYAVKVRLDSAGQSYIFSDSYGALKQSLRKPTIIGKQTYIESNFNNQLRNTFYKSVLANLSGKDERTSGAVRLFTASVTTNETFTKIFGGDEVAVDATGNINLSVSGASEKSSNQNSNTGKNSTFTPKFEQRQRFNLRGTIGKKVEILFDQDSEREFDFENNIKITYTGFDDEVLQKLEAGNIDLSLPGTEFVTTGGQNKGLFGIKALFKLANLNITTIASIQNGEKTKLSLAGGALKSEINKKVYDYAKAKFFFLESYYRDNYENYSGRIHVADPKNDISNIRVFRYSPNNQSIPGNIPGIAINRMSILTDPNLANLTNDEIDTLDNGQTIDGNFLEISEEQYDLDTRLGILKLHSPIADGDLLAVTYQTATKTVGLFTPSYLKLKMLWSNKPKPADSSWTLELKNIYDFGITGLSADDAKTLKISYRANGTGTDQTIVKDKKGNDIGLLKMLHVDEQGQNSEPDDIVDEAQYGYGLDFSNGYLIFPKLRPFDPSIQQLDGFSEEVYPDTLRIWKTNSIYDLDRTPTNITQLQNINTFNIYLSSSKKSSTISLGINILEGSEEVILSGEKLEKDIGYAIDYFSGNIELLDPRALLPTADIEIKYEQAQLFQINKRTIFGARAEYSLADYGLGANSFIGTTALFQSQSTINKRVQLGEEPFSNFVWDVNTSLEFNAKFLTKLVNYIPLVSSNQPSKINIRGEYAKIFPNPNTSNGLMKNEENGVAYLDDFEAVKRTFPLGTTRKAWSLASTPLERQAADRGHIVWFVKQEAREKISLIKTNPTDNVLTLGLAFKPKSNDPINSWGGIIRGFSSSAAKELSESRFIELWIKNVKGTSRINIDLGAISEDQNGNRGEPDREVKSALQVGVTEAQDVGLDGLNDQQEADTLLALGITPGSTNLTSIQQSTIDSLQVRYPWGIINKSAEDPFGDNWNKEQSQPQNIENIENAITNNDISGIKVNGLEKNIEDGTTRIGDTEDLNGNGVIDQQTNSYFRYSFSTNRHSKDTSFVIGKGKDNWFLYRIPILSPDSAVNAVILPDITNARIWINPEDNSDDVIALQIAELQFVTSEWTFAKENPSGVVVDPNGKQIDSNDIKKIVEISSISTEEGGEYQKPPGVRREYVQGSSDGRKREIKEQSLSLKLNDLPAGASAVIVKNISSSDLRNYGKMKMFVHGDIIPKGNVLLPDENENTDNSPINFFFRFGNNSTNYYEIEHPLFAGWAERNFVEISFDEITAFKFDKTNVPDPLTDIRTFILTDGKTLRIKGSPTIAGITQLYLGAINNETVYAYTGDIWFDELRLTDANDKPGQAVKANLSFNLADFASFNGFVQYQTSEFRTVDQRFNANSGDTRNWNINTSVALHKFHLENWGINLPFTFNISNSRSDPKYLPGNDILVESAKDQNDKDLILLRLESDEIRRRSDSLRSVTSDTVLINPFVRDSIRQNNILTLAENFESTLRTSNVSKGFSLNFSKSKNEKNFWLLRYTVDNITSSFNYNTSEQKNPQFISNRNESWASATSYNIGFKRKPFKPLSWMPLSGMPMFGTVFKNIKETEFNYMLFTGATTDFSITSTKSEAIERDQLGNPVNKPTIATLSSTRGYGLSISPWQTLNSSIGVKYQTDLRGLSAGQILQGIANGLNPFDGFSDFVFDRAIDTIKGGKTLDSLIYNRDFATTNTFNVNYNPMTFPFLTHTANYTFSNTGRRQKPPISIYNESSSISRRVQIDMGFSIRSFISSVKEPFNQQGRKDQAKPDDSKKSRRDKFKNLNQGTGLQTGREVADTTKDNSKTSILDVSRKVGSATERALKMINDVRFTIGFDNNFQINNTDKKIDPALQWFGYTTTQNSGFVENIFSFDLDTIRQFNKSKLDTSKNLFNYSAGKSINYGFNYGFNFVYFTVDLRYDYAENRTLSPPNILRRTVSRSTLFPWLKFSPIPMFYDITIRANNIGRWPIFNLMAGLTNNMGFGFTFNSKETENWISFTGNNFTGIDSTRLNGRSIQLESVSNQQTFPQINYDIVWKGNVTQNIVFTNTNITGENKSSVQTSNTKSITTNISYTKRGGFKVPLWFLKKKQLDNEIRVGAVASYTKRIAYNESKKTDQTSDKTKIDDSITWSVEPRIDYSFTKWITGGSFFRYESSKTLRTGKITRILAGIVVNITIGT
ncbi:cell surface protein SprA [bacterium]|nr:cell surface protein SprA [bacterium]